MDDRNMHYLGREYMFHRRWRECIQTLTRHLSLPTATWPDERCASMRFIARAHEALGNVREAERWLLRAVGEAPHLREPWVETAALCYRQRDWEGTAFFALRALKIAERPKTYICEASAWGSLPYDLASLALYETGRVREAIPLLEKALEIAPGDERLQENLRLMRAETRRG